MRRAALLGVVAVLALASPVVAQDGSLGVRLLEDGPYLDVEVEPGAQVRAAVEVRSTTSGPAAVELYPAAATGRDDAFDFADGREANELSGWTTVTPASVELEPGGAVQVDVVVDVPDDAAPGPRSAVVWAQVGEQAGGVVQVRRVGVRVHVDVVRATLLAPAVAAGALVLLAGAATVLARRRSAPG